MFRLKNDLKIVVREGNDIATWNFRNVFNETKANSKGSGLSFLFEMIKDCETQKNKQVSCTIVRGWIVEEGTGNTNQATPFEKEEKFKGIIEKFFTEFTDFIADLAHDHPEVADIYEVKNKNLDKRKILKMLGEKAPKVRMLERIAKLKKERNNISYKLNRQYYSCLSEDERNRLDRILREIPKWHDLFDKNFQSDYGKAYDATEPNYTKELNSRRYEQRTLESNSGITAEKAVKSALTAIWNQKQSSKLFTNLLRSGFLKSFDQKSGKFKINRSEDIFYYDQSKLAGAEKIKWHFS